MIGTGPSRRHTIAILCLVVWIPAFASAEGPEIAHAPIITLERSKNSNVVQYDLQLSADGSPVAEEPVIGYWRNIEGDTWPIHGIQHIAYGFDASCSDACKLVTLDMRAPVGRSIRVYEVDGKYRAVTPIDGKPAFIERIYIQSIERRFLWPKVAHIDFEGVDTITGERRTERFVP